jgi:hypothetical protein
MMMHNSGGVISLVTVYLGGYLALVLLAVCLATGIYYIAELAEEYSRAAKWVLTWAVRGVLALHAALLLLDRQPTSCVLAGAAAHVAYASLLPRFPHFAPASPAFVAAVLACALSHALWLRHFYLHTFASAEFVAGFFVVAVWLVPFGLFVSLAASDGVLPTAGPSMPPFAAAAASRDAAAYRRAAAATGAPAPPEPQELGGERKRGRNLVAGVIGNALRWVRGRRDTGALSGAGAAYGRDRNI